MTSYLTLRDFGVFLFKLRRLKQVYGINVSSIEEILPCPRITVFPSMPKYVVGAVTIHGSKTIPVVDLNDVLTGTKLAVNDKTVIVVVKCGGGVYAFLASKAERIINVEKDDLLPSESIDMSTYLLGTVEFDKGIVEIIDIEKVICDIYSQNTVQAAQPSLVAADTKVSFSAAQA